MNPFWCTDDFGWRLKRYYGDGGEEELWWSEEYQKFRVEGWMPSHTAPRRHSDNAGPRGGLWYDSAGDRWGEYWDRWAEMMIWAQSELIVHLSNQSKKLKRLCALMDYPEI